MKHLLTAVLLLLNLTPTHTWSGILIDNESTQLYFPSTIPHSVGNVHTFGLQHLPHSRAALLNGKVYFIGGDAVSSSNVSTSVFVFDPVTNTTTRGVPIHYGRQDHAVAVVGMTLF
jgi:hypothetical protein